MSWSYSREHQKNILCMIMAGGQVIPGHWDMFADNSEDPMKFADYISVKYPYGPKCILPKVMEEIAL